MRERVLFALDAALGAVAIVLVMALALVVALVSRVIGLLVHGLSGDWRKRR